MLFKNRESASDKLIPFLKKYQNDDCIVLAIPRGGIPVAYSIAKKYGFPMDVVLTKKIGHPMNPEWAIGAVSLESRVVDRSIGLPEEYIDKETERIRKILNEKYKFYMGLKQPVELKNKTVIIVDDGVATGNTMKATIELIRKKHPKKIVAAIPVAPPRTASELKLLVDDFICLATPDDFMAVGQFYFDFGEVTDKEAVDMLKKANEEFV
jgi:putative phosphoribosyl transferase